jgi:hypothetical protein
VDALQVMGYKRTLQELVAPIVDEVRKPSAAEGRQETEAEGFFVKHISSVPLKHEHRLLTSSELISSVRPCFKLSASGRCICTRACVRVRVWVWVCVVCVCVCVCVCVSVRGSS